MNRSLSTILILVSLYSQLHDCLLDFEQFQGYSPIVFESSIFKRYTEEKEVTKPSKSIHTSKIETEMTTSSSDQDRETMVITKEKQLPKKPNSFEKLLTVVIGDHNKTEQRRNLAIEVCDYVLTQSYLSNFDSQEETLQHPVVSSLKMTSICPNNMTSCCNEEETQEIHKRFLVSQKKSVYLLKSFKTTFEKLCKSFQVSLVNRK
jgi:hypothetical protein